MPHSYARQNPYLGALLILFFKTRFIELATSHGMAVNLEDEDQAKRARDDSSELLQRWEENYRSDYAEMRQAICVAFWSSFWMILSAAVFAFAIGYWMGRIDPALPIDTPKAISAFGTGLVAWATLMELGGDFPVWDGKAFPQLAHSVLFKAMFLAGVAMILVAHAL